MKDAERPMRMHVTNLDAARRQSSTALRQWFAEGDQVIPVERLKLDLDRAGATIVEVSGKRNLTDFAELVISFRIPTSIVYDKDSSEFRDMHEIALQSGLSRPLQLTGHELGLSFLRSIILRFCLAASACSSA
jgi:hypothetical protein